VKTVKNLWRITRRPLSQTQEQVQVSANAASQTEVTDKNLLLMANLNSLAKKTELTTSYIQRGNT